MSTLLYSILGVVLLIGSSFLFTYTSTIRSKWNHMITKSRRLRRRKENAKIEHKTVQGIPFHNGFFLTREHKITEHTDLKKNNV